MDCPICNKAMTDLSYESYSIGGWDLDYPDQLHEEYTCKKCKVTYENGHWNIPEVYHPSKQQIQTVEFIQNVLGNDAPPPTKSLYWKYINTYLQEAIDAVNNRKKYNTQDSVDWDDWDESFDYPEEYFY